MALTSANDNNVREYHLRYMDQTSSFRGAKRVVGVGNVDGVSAASLDNLKAHLGRGKGLIKGGYVYVIGDDTGYTKIGLAKAPVGRMAALQTGNPRRLILYRAFRFDALTDAEKVEKWSHDIAAKRYTKTLGEWFSCTPHQAHIIIDEASDEVGVPYCVTTPIVNRELTSQRLVA